MHVNAIATPSATKQFRGFTIQLTQTLRDANRQMIEAALEKGRAFQSAKMVLKRKGNKEFLNENGFISGFVKRHIKFAQVWGEFSLEQIANIDVLMLFKLTENLGLKPRPSGRLFSLSDAGDSSSSLHIAICTSIVQW